MPWIRRYILFHGKRHPKNMGRAEIEVEVRDGKGQKYTGYTGLGKVHVALHRFDKAIVWGVLLPQLEGGEVR